MSMTTHADDDDLSRKVTNASRYEKSHNETQRFGSAGRRARRRPLHEYNESRMRLLEIMDGRICEIIMGTLITYHFVIIFIETNEGGLCRDRGLSYCDVPLWIRLSNIALLLVYTVECGARFYIYRSDFFYSKWNTLDLLVVVTGYLDVIVAEIIAAKDSGAGEGVPSLFFLRLFRIVRMVRAFRLWFSIRELYLLLHGFVSSMKSIFWGSLIMLGLIVMWSIVLIEMIDPVNRDVDHGDKEFCKRAFSSVWLTSLYLFQTLMAGDGWGTCSRPIVEAAPWTFILFFGALGTILMGFGNLILAVIVARAEEARQEDSAQRMKDKMVDEDRQKKVLEKIFAEIDVDKSGGITLEELLEAYDHHEELGTMMRLMDIARDEMESVYRLLDEGSADHVATLEFVKNLYDMRNRDPRLTLMFVKYHVMDTTRHLEEHINFTRTHLMERLDAQDVMLKELYSSILGRPPRLPESSFPRTPRRKSSTDSVGSVATSQSPFGNLTPSHSARNRDSSPTCRKELQEWQGALKMNGYVQDRFLRIVQEAEASVKGLVSELAEAAMSTHAQASARGDAHPASRGGDEPPAPSLHSSQCVSWPVSPGGQQRQSQSAAAASISHQAFPVALPTVQPEQLCISAADAKPALPAPAISLSTCLDSGGVIRI